MKCKIILRALLAATLVVALGGTQALADKAATKRAKLEAKAKITRAEAEKIALANVPNGTIQEAEIEKEHGRLIWSFDIATPGTKDITEVQVNAKTGKVVSVETESPKDQAREAQDAAKKKKAAKKDAD